MWWKRGDDGGLHVVVKATFDSYAVLNAGAPAALWTEIRCRLEWLSGWERACARQRMIGGQLGASAESAPAGELSGQTLVAIWLRVQSLQHPASPPFSAAGCLLTQRNCSWM